MRYMKYVTLLVAVLVVSACAFGDTIDPVGFCPTPATVTACTTSNGLSSGTILVSSTSFGMFKNGNGGTSINPWDLLVAIPNYTGSAPTITSPDFTLNGTTDVGQFLSTSSLTLYQFAGTSGDASMNVGNMFGSAYSTFYGSTPSYYEVFEYSFSPDIANNTPYSFTVGGSGLPMGTVLAGAGGTNPFTTPWTTAGLVGPPTTVPDGGMTLMLLGGAMVGLESLRRKFRV